MKKHTSHPSGFAHILLVILLVAALGGLAFFGLKGSKGYGGALSHLGGGWAAGCSSNARKELTHTPMDMGDVATVTPYGLTAGAHVTPIDHLYFYPKEGPRDKYPVYAMADGVIKEIQVRGVNVSNGEKRPPEYRIVMQHSCQTISYFDLVTKLDQSILDKAPDAATRGFNGSIAIKSGQEIGRIGGQSLDTAVYNLNLTLKGFIHPDLYKGEDWKVHTDDFFSYFSEPLKSSMLAKNARTVEPRSGKIDYDQPGKLIGNWFKEGTGGYSGNKNEHVGNSNGQGYWTAHLAIFYDAYDPSKIVVSIGDFGGQPLAFRVSGNSPDPAKVSASSEVVKYELLDAPPGAGVTQVQQGPVKIVGTVLLQVLPGEKLRVEVFVGKTAAQVSGFTNPIIYAR